MNDFLGGVLCGLMLAVVVAGILLLTTRPPEARRTQRRDRGQ